MYILQDKKKSLRIMMVWKIEIMISHFLIGVINKVIDNLLNQRTKYHGLSLRPRLNKDIVEGRFDISEIIRIERKNDEHTISDKTFDFLSGTIRHLLNNGYKDTIDYINTRTN